MFKGIPYVRFDVTWVHAMNDNVAEFFVLEKTTLKLVKPGLEVEFVVAVGIVATFVGVAEVEKAAVLHVGGCADDAWVWGLGEGREEC